MFNCENLKVNDRVWIGNQRNGKSEIRTIYKVTPQQVVIDWNGNGCYFTRYYKSNGHLIGGRYLSSRNILAIASPADCQKWDREQAAEKNRQEQAETAKQNLEVKRQELSAMFGPAALVTTESFGDEATRKYQWTVEFHGLTEDQVKNLAHQTVGEAINAK